jgi:anti-sigma B factor antagonist
MATPLKIGSRIEEGGIAVLTLSGEVDVSNSGLVREAALKLISSGENKLIVDLAGIEYMDSTGLGTMVGLHKRLREKEGEFILAGSQPQVRRLFDITGLVRVLKMSDDLAAALEEAKK